MELKVLGSAEGSGLLKVLVCSVFQEECMIRYKMLAELVQKRKQAKS